MATLREFLSDVVLDAPGITEPLALSALLIAMQSVCSRTMVWEETEQTRGRGAEIDIDVPTGARVVDVLSVSNADTWQPLLKTSCAVLDKEIPAWRAEKGDPTHYFRKGDVLMVYPNSSESKKFMVRAAYEPIDAMVDFPDELVRLVREAVTALAKFRVLSMPAQTWTNPNAAANYLEMADRAIGGIIADIEGGYVQAQNNKRTAYFL